MLDFFGIQLANRGNLFEIIPLLIIKKVNL